MPSWGLSIKILLSTGVVSHSIRECQGFCTLGIGHAYAVGADGVCQVVCGLVVVVWFAALVHLRIGCLAAAWFVSFGYLLILICE